MNKLYKVFCPLLLLVAIACGKKDDPVPESKPAPVDNGLKIEIVSGNNQWDTVGHELQKKLIIKLSRAGDLLKNHEVEFKNRSCLDSTVVARKTDSLGIAEFPWRLHAAIGVQEVEVSAHDAVLSAKTKVKATAEGRAPAGAWLPGNCIPNGNISSIVQQSSGRILLALFRYGRPFYSDDNGITWNRFSSFPHTYDVAKIALGGADEIYMATENNGIFYSGDNGKTWQARSAGITDVRYFTDLAVLKNGKLLASTYFGGLFLSSDKGITWERVSKTMDFNDRFSNFNEAPNGDLYVVSDDSELYKSPDNGKTWSKIRTSSFYNVQSIFIDDNGDMYIGTNKWEGEVHKSSDNGSTWKLVYTTPPLPGVYDRVTRMTKAKDSFYFAVDGYGLVRTKDFSAFDKLHASFTDYLVAENNTIILGGAYPGQILYNTKP